MPDITQHESAQPIQRRLEGQSQGGGSALLRHQPSRKIAESYQEAARALPLDDRITILGIPVEQITPVTQAALAGLVAEINHWRNVVKRLERSVDKRLQTDSAVLEPEAFMRALATTLGQPAGPGQSWVIVLAHVSTYEDIRRSSGLLAANSTLADVAYRLKDVQWAHEPEREEPPPPPPVARGKKQVAVPPPPPLPPAFQVLGYAGGSNLAGVIAVPDAMLDTAFIAKTVREHLAGGYVVGGIDMALAITVAAAAVGNGESPLLALGRADHLLRTV